MEIINPKGKQTLQVETELCGRKLTLEVNRVGFRSMINRVSYFSIFILEIYVKWIIF